MQISYQKIGDLKIKFGSLLSYLFFTVHLNIENINHALISSSFLDILEDNQFDKFMGMSNKDVLEILFPGAKEIENESINDIGKLYWSGIQYMNIFLNYRIPLRQIFLTLPLMEMINKYDVYHEMNEIELCKDYLKNEYLNNSILKYFRKEKGITVRQLSLLTSISESTIKYLENNNENFFNLSAKYLLALSNALNIDSAFYKKKSNFVPCTYDFLSNECYLVKFSATIGKYLNKPLPNLKIKLYKEKISDKSEAFLYINETSYVAINNQEIYIDDSLLTQLFSMSLDEYISESLNTNLVF